MSRTLIILRHGKSDWTEPGATDHERPLKKRGRRAAGTVGRFLSRTDHQPDRIVTSSAVRALTTAELAAEEGEWSCPIHVEPELYLASVTVAVDIVRATGDDVRRLLVVGHEPTLSGLIGAVTGGATPHFPTAATACIELDAKHWSDVELGTGKLAWLVTPRELEA